MVYALDNTTHLVLSEAFGMVCINLVVYTFFDGREFCFRGEWFEGFV